jgi:hypothetical protein
VAAARRTASSNYESVLSDLIGPGHVIKSRREFEALRFMRAEDLRPDQRTAINAIREQLGRPVEGEWVRKILPVHRAVEKIAANNPNLSGYFARSSDVYDARTTQELIDRIRIDGRLGADQIEPGWPHVIVETKVNAAIAGNSRIPRNSGYATGNPDVEFVENLDWPNSGNALATSRDGRLVPEHTTQPTAMDTGFDEEAEQWVSTYRFRHSDGVTPLQQTIVIDGVPTTASDWKLIVNPENPETFKWVPLG